MELAAVRVVCYGARVGRIGTAVNKGDRMTKLEGSYSAQPSTERRREYRAKAGFYGKPRSSAGHLHKSRDSWRRLQARSAKRAFANRTDAAKGRR
jgi:hypothetical protein